MTEEPIPRDPPDVMRHSLWDAGYAFAAEYFPGLSREEFYLNAQDFSLAYAEWESIVGDEPTEASVARFYREAYGLIFSMLRRLRPEGAIKDVRQPATIITRAMRSRRLRTILDFGGGIGSLAAMLDDQGLMVGHYDVGHTGAFGRWMLRGTGVTCYRRFEDALLHSGWQAIAVLDVLEHTWSPVELMRELYNALAPYGLLFITADRFGPHPTHLVRNYWLKEDAPKVLQQLGLSPHKAGDPHYGISAWMKVK
jgi:hypothetical protein